VTAGSEVIVRALTGRGADPEAFRRALEIATHDELDRALDSIREDSLDRLNDWQREAAL